MYSQARQSSDPFMSKQEVFIINQSRRPLDLLIYSSTLFSLLDHHIGVDCLWSLYSFIYMLVTAAITARFMPFTIL